MSTFTDELTAQCDALISAWRDAGVLVGQSPDCASPNAWVVLRQALAAWDVPQDDQRLIEDTIREDADQYPLALILSGTEKCCACIQVLTLTRFVQYGRHPACITYTRWYLDVVCALMAHGYYDPTTNHTPPPGEELDALELREDGRDLLNNLMPGFGDAAAGQRPSTEEGRRLLWHRVVDPETGKVTMVNDADIPDNPDDEENDDDDRF